MTRKILVPPLKKLQATSFPHRESETLFNSDSQLRVDPLIDLRFDMGAIIASCGVSANDELGRKR